MVGTDSAAVVPISSRGAMRQRLAAIGVAVLVASLVPGAAPADAQEVPTEPTVAVAGGGYGHGVGLSQYGAKGQALDGRTAEQIVTHYYDGAEVLAVDELPIDAEFADRPLWVGLQQNRSSAAVAWSGSGGTLCIDPDPTNEATPCSRTVNMRTGEHMTIAWDAAQTACSLVRTTTDGEDMPLGVTAPECRMSLASDRGTLWFESRGYPNGTIEIRRAPGTESFHVVAALDLETYVAGIAEVPSTWPAAALEAQALAARSFALNRFLAFEKPEFRAPGDTGLSDSAKAGCWCHVYDDTRSQVYGGSDSMHAEWVDAQSATAGQAIAYRQAGWASYTRSQVIEAYYSSSNAGVSVSNVHAWGSSKAYPYLIAVDDPWSVSEATGNPNASWEREITAEDLAGNLGWDAVLRAALVAGAPTPTVEIEGIDGGEWVARELTGDPLRGAFGLLSAQVSDVSMTGGLTCVGLFATHTGTNGDDTLTGTDGIDVIVGRGGNDTIRAKGGDDVVCGNSGADDLRGGMGDDRLYGGGGLDTIDGGGGSDIVNGGTGADVITGGNGPDFLNGSRGLDAIDGEGGTDEILGGPGSDALDGGSGVDSVFGNRGMDSLSGGAGSDWLRGGAGPDALDGEEGDEDRCFGNDGVDTATAACEIVDTVP